jgi:RNase P/RNase MRP subunit POP5
VSVLAIVVLAVLAVLLVLAIVGGASASRRNRAQSEHFGEQLAKVDRELAHALANDRGWERGTLEAAARAAFAERHGDVEIAALELVQVLDRPGTDEDLAVFRVRRTSDGTAARVTLGRRDGAWYGAAVEDEPQPSS